MSYRALDVSATLQQLGFTDLVPSKVAYGADQNPITVACSGPLVVSSSKAIDVPRPLVWDVNGYYRDLGIEPPYRPSKRELRLAYQARDGQNSERLTYCLKQLLDPDVRRRYDRMPLGSRFDDKYEWAKLDRVSAMWAGERTALTGELHTVEDFHRAHGMTPLPPKEAETPSEIRHIESHWPFAFYLWNSRILDDLRLQDWQEMIINEAWKRGLRIQFSVGYVGRTDERWTHLIHSDGAHIFFLSDVVVPTCQDAEELLDSITPRIITTPQESKEPNAKEPNNGINKRKESDSMTTTTDEDLDFDFSGGGLAAQEQAKADREARKAARGTRTYLTSILKEDGDQCLIRFVTDEPPGGPNGANIYVNQHYVPTKSAPRGKPKDADWPDRAGAVCRYTKIGPPDAKRPAFNDCYICDVMRTDKGKKYGNGMRGWAIAVVRKEVVGTQEMVEKGQIPAEKVGVVVGYQDDMIEVDELGPDGKLTGNKVQKKNFIIINMGMKNFWDGILAFYKRYGTLLDRDYEITRTGEDLQVDYKAVPLDVIQRPVRDEQGNLTGQTEPFDLRNPKYAELYSDHGIELKPLITRQMAKKHYDRYFDARVEVDWERDDDDDAQSSSQRNSPSPDSATAKPTGANSDKLAKMKAELLGSNPGAQAAPTGMVDFSS